MGEILYLQYGNLSNIILTPYFNIQYAFLIYGHNDFASSRLYAVSKTGLCIPRTLIFDMKVLYGYYAPSVMDKVNEPEDPNVQMFQANSIVKSPFTRYLDGEIEEHKEEDEFEMTPDEFQKYNEELKTDSHKTLKQCEEIKEDDKEKDKEEKKDTSSYEEQMKSLKKLYDNFKFEESTQYWVDYSQTSYTSSNRIPVPLYEDIDDMADYQNGLVFAQENSSFRDEYEDGFRSMLEKSDLVSGMVVTFESNNIFGAEGTNCRADECRCA